MEQTKSNDPSFIKKIVRNISPPPGWRTGVMLLTAVIIGLIFHIAYVSNAVSYLSDDPRACVNCHVMNPQFATWSKSSHGRDVTCNDCHVPQDNFVKKYYFKAMDGLRHATMFTFRMEPQVIRIKEAGRNAVQQNCIRCHENNIHPVSVRSISNAMILDEGDRVCWDCHREVPHGKVHSLSSTPNARIPGLKPVVPEWILK